MCQHYNLQRYMGMGTPHSYLLPVAVSSGAKAQLAFLHSNGNCDPICVLLCFMLKTPDFHNLFYGIFMKINYATHPTARYTFPGLFCLLYPKFLPLCPKILLAATVAMVGLAPLSPSARCFSYSSPGTDRM